MIKIQFPLTNQDVAESLVAISNRYDIDIDIKCGSISVDGKSIVGVMQLVGHDVDISIVKGDSTDIISYIKEIDSIRQE